MRILIIVWFTMFFLQFIIGLGNAVGAGDRINVDSRRATCSDQLYRIEYIFPGHLAGCWFGGKVE